VGRVFPDVQFIVPPLFGVNMIYNRPVG
jgi:hypothetical protein